MGQAFRRATGRIRNPPSIDATSTSATSKNAADLRPPVVHVDKVQVSNTLEKESPTIPDNISRVNADNVLEDKDQSYDAMLRHMVGRIKSKPAGKLETGEASVMARHNRPMPKLRNTKPESSNYEEQPTPPGTLNVAQVRHIMLLHQGKAEDHDGPMEISQIAAKFRVDAEQIGKLLKALSLPPEDSAKLDNPRQ